VPLSPKGIPTDLFGAIKTDFSELSITTLQESSKTERDGKIGSEGAKKPQKENNLKPLPENRDSFDEVRNVDGFRGVATGETFSENPIGQSGRGFNGNRR
jgi:hypothetical protein